MEVLKEEKETRWSTRILLILNLIIWTIILFMIILWNGVVNAATTNTSMTNYTLYYTNNTYPAGQNGETITAVYPVSRIDTGWSTVQGTINGTIYLTIDNTNIALEDISLIVYNGVNLNENATINKSCTRSSGTSFGNLIRCQITFQAVSYSASNVTPSIRFSNNINSLSKITVSGNASIDTNTPASTIDIANQTISIINSMTDKIQQAIENSNSNQAIIGGYISNATNSLQQAIINSIQAQNQTCINYNFNNTENIEIENKYISNNGEIKDTQSVAVSNYTPVSKGEIIIEGTENYSTAGYCIYDKNKRLISCNGYQNNNTTSILITQKGYIRYTVVKWNNNFNFKGDYCQSNTDAIIENQNENTNILADKMDTFNNSIFAEYTPENPDKADFDDFEDVEDELKEYTNVNLESFNVDLDTDTNNWVWTTLTNLIQANALVFGMVISILSIGLIKLIMNR